MLSKKNLINNQCGQMAWAVLIGIMVLSGTMYMMQNNVLAINDYSRLNQTVNLSILGYSTIEKIKMALAGNLPACANEQGIKDFRNLQKSGYETLKWPTNETVVPDCLFNSEEKKLISSINIKVFSKGLANTQSLHADIGIGLTLQGKMGVKFNRSTSINLSVASLANFGLIQTSQTTSIPLFDLPTSSLPTNTTKVQVFAKTFIRYGGNLPIENLVSSPQVTYLSPVYTKSKNILVSGSEKLQQDIITQMKGGLYLNSLANTNDLWTDSAYQAAWIWDMDHGFIYDDSGGYLLPIPGMYIRVASLAGNPTPPPDYSSIRAGLKLVNNAGDVNNILGTKNIVETCKSGTSNNLLIYENISKDLSIDFSSSSTTVTGSTDSRPILCGLISAQNLTIKLSSQKTHNILIGLFHVSGKITIQGEGTLDIINPFQQKTLPNDISTILGDSSFIENQIKNISTYSATVGRNFTLPIFKNTSSATNDFKPLEPNQASLVTSNSILNKTDCPISGTSGVNLCWNPTIPKPEANAAFFNNNSEKLLFLVEETL